MKVIQKILKIFFKILSFPFYVLILGLIYFYKLCISPLLADSCIYSPTCSTYAVIAIKRFGVIKGSKLALKRIMRCAPGFKGGVDRVPENIKGEFRWLI
jgi:putative membrane protein insertion efficiency factor